MLIVQPIGGLANRMRVLAFAKYIADITHTDLICRWTMNWELNAPFEAIFKPVNFPVINVQGKQYPLHRKRKWWRNIEAKLWLKYHSIDVWMSNEDVNIALAHDKDEERIAFTDKIKIALLEDRNVYLATGNNLGKFDVSFFAPTNELMSKVNEALSFFQPGHSNGLHIRRTDNMWAIEHSPIELFEQKIEEIIAFDSLARFYLATDDFKTADYLLSKYGDRIVYRQKELSRDTENGIREAIIDMWTLGYMDAIYGSYWSSFSEVASWINNKPLYCISDVTIMNNKTLVLKDIYQN